jgi:hypothetical protein
MEQGAQGIQFSWTEMGQGIVLLVFMSFFVSALVEVAKDALYYWLKLANGFLNWFRVPANKAQIREEDKFFSETASKMLAFIVALILCIAIDYGAIAKIVQYGQHARGAWAIGIDYLATAAIIRLGGVAVYDLVAAMTQKLLAAKALAAQLVQNPPQNVETTTTSASSSSTTEKTSSTVQEAKQ